MGAPRPRRHGANNQRQRSAAGTTYSVSLRPHLFDAGKPRRHARRRQTALRAGDVNAVTDVGLGRHAADAHCTAGRSTPLRRRRRRTAGGGDAAGVCTRPARVGRACFGRSCRRRLGFRLAAAANRLVAGARHALAPLKRAAACGSVCRRALGVTAPDCAGALRARRGKSLVVATLKLTLRCCTAPEQAGDAQPLWDAAEALLLQPDTTLAVRGPAAAVPRGCVAAHMPQLTRHICAPPGHQRVPPVAAAPAGAAGPAARGGRRRRASTAAGSRRRRAFQRRGRGRGAVVRAGPCAPHSTAGAPILCGSWLAARALRRAEL